MTRHSAYRLARPAALLFLLVGLWTVGCDSQRPPSATPESAASRASAPPATTYVGRDACAECHAEEVEAWRGSHHDLAMQLATPETVLGNFDHPPVTVAGEQFRFERADNTYRVHVVDADGETTTYPVPYVFGVDPLQQLLLPIGAGRHQALSLAWDARPAESGGQRWYPLHEDVSGTDDVLHWKAPAFNWNFMCAECHSTGLEKRYDAATDRYETRWSEIDVSCEACHGPASGHVEWAKGERTEGVAHAGFAFTFPSGGESGETSRSAGWETDPATGRPVRVDDSDGTAREDVTAEIEACAPCHSRRSSITASHRPGEPYLDHFLPALLSEGLYFADGQIRDEVYVYGSFLQSKMHGVGVTCSDCHDPHSGQLRREGNAVCTACHDLDTYDTKAHHGHAADTEAAQCVTCHMASRTYMGVDARRDHSFRIPQPSVSDAIGSPDPCVSCHAPTHDGAEPVAQWASNTILSWRGTRPAAQAAHAKERAEAAERAALAIEAGRSGTPQARERLIELVDHADTAGITRATAVSLLAFYPDPTSAAALGRAVGHPDPLVRYAAAVALDAYPPALRSAIATPLLSDPHRLVRIEAARLLAEGGSSDGDAAFARALEEYRRSQQIHADRPESHVNLGSLARRRGKLDEAVRAYRAALAVGDHFVPAWINLADAQRAGGDEEGAWSTLNRGLARHPESADLHYAMALAHWRKQARLEAVDHFAQAYRAEPSSARLALGYALALDAMGDSVTAESVLTRAVEAHPLDRDLVLALLDVLRRRGALGESLPHLERLRVAHPDDASLEELLRELNGG